MFVLIIGSGVMSLILSRMFFEAGYGISVLCDDSKIRRLVRDGILVICGDITSVEDMKRAGILRADKVIAASDRDEKNLVISELAKNVFGKTDILCLVNDPQYKDVFKNLGVERVLCKDELISKEIWYQAMEKSS
ncbi:TrkA-N domain-containing protein [Caldanaerobius fijiensis DSM 17918]|uniref:TrkA-N domain-containing protein n=1 Tax=Caldanaerobius fijiensis DSM 17918 TaxID=1121256 RepID=A0A1M5FFV4_9THEO|nr:TrkA-N domain-containing protein [Caldanaerobius fijiensis DSM 17918]